MSETKNLVIDFDSTFSKVEALDLLGEISLANNPFKDEILNDIVGITNKGMEGKLSFRESLDERIKLLKANRHHLDELIVQLKNHVSTSFKRNKEFLKEYADHIYIISNGFKDFIIPVVSEYGILERHVHANNFRFDEHGNITGFNEDNLLSNNKGKPELIKSLNLEGEIFVIGDGYTDYEIKKEGFANKFYAFTENVTRDNVLVNADHILPSLDEFLYQHKMTRALSYPKNRIRVLILENIHKKGIEILKNEGYNIEIHPKGLSEEELIEKIKDVSILCIRSKTQVTAKVIDNAKRLLAVGAFCIGTNQIDLTKAVENGVAVFNAPFSNTRSVVELVIGNIIMLMRNLPDKVRKMHEGVWQKSASGSNEIRGKKLGIVGYGNIGSQLSVLAESMGMKVYYYDIEEKLALGNAVKCSKMQELLKMVDVVTLHVDGRRENENIFGKKEFDLMKHGSIFINLSRGHVVDIQALRASIAEGKIRGCAVDVFPKEPYSNAEAFVSELKGLPNTILSPHIGGSTQEAQENIAEFVPNRIMEYINSGNTTNSVNFPNLTLPELVNAHRFIHVHTNNPGVLAKINQVLAKHEINIAGQYLKTNEHIGYVITDINKDYPEEVVKDLKSIESTIRVRVLY